MSLQTGLWDESGVPGLLEFCVKIGQVPSSAGLLRVFRPLMLIRNPLEETWQLSMAVP